MDLKSPQSDGLKKYVKEFSITELCAFGQLILRGEKKR